MQNFAFYALKNLRGMRLGARLLQGHIREGLLCQGCLMEE